MDKKTALHHLVQTRNSLQIFLKESGPVLIADRPIEGDWTTKDVLGHITAWDLALLNPLTKLASGESFVPEEIPDGELYNRQQAEMRVDRDLPEVIEEMNNVRHEILTACEQLADENFDRTYPAPWGGEDTLAGMIYGLAWHENEHLETLQIKKVTTTQ